ncbi:VOC family protein [Methyloligella solikamskensis]|uniref:VOC family protein n=1 Tax=Methyloligella solikamskensis TaxID=1177756 RepID=A0ABW3J6F1_9HYPH
MSMIDPDSIGFGRIAATLPVQDMARALSFYCGTLGFTKIFENGDPVGFVILRRDGAELHLTLQKAHKPATFPVAHLMVQDANGLATLCEASGLRIVKGVRDKEYGLRAFVFEDTEGNRIDVGQPLRSAHPAE